MDAAAARATTTARPAAVTTVGDVMTREIFAVGVDTSLETAARLLAERHISAAPVVDGEGRPLGVISQHDLADPARVFTRKLGRARYYVLAGGALTPVAGERVTLAGLVADLMSPYVLSVTPETPVGDAARLMLADEVHRLLVVRGGRLVGIVSTMDVLKALAQK